MSSEARRHPGYRLQRTHATGRCHHALPMLNNLEPDPSRRGRTNTYERIAARTIQQITCLWQERLED